ncbi:MAG: hypothetical protein ACFFG0_05500 [Candidatus Thorarchaeota archaeon]
MIKIERINKIEGYTEDGYPAKEEVKNVFGVKNIIVEIEEGIAYQKIHHRIVDTYTDNEIWTYLPFSVFEKNFDFESKTLLLKNADYMQYEQEQEKKKEEKEKKGFYDIQKKCNDLEKLTKKQKEEIDILQKELYTERQLIEKTNARQMLSKMEEDERKTLEKEKAEQIAYLEKNFPKEDDDEEEYKYIEADYDDLRQAGVEKDTAKKIKTLPFKIWKKESKYEDSYEEKKFIINIEKIDYIIK